MIRIDYVPFPPTSFPFRDLLLLEQMPIAPNERICEVGIGSGGTCARLARLDCSVTGLDVSTKAIEAVRDLEAREPGLEFHTADITRSADLAPFCGTFDTVVSCDTLEHVADPRAFFEGIASMLAPGGRFLVTFPNEPRASMHGITCFDTPEELCNLVASAGLAIGSCGAAVMTEWAEFVADRFGWGPVALVRRALAAQRRLRGAAGGGASSSKPQAFDETAFFANRERWQKLSVPINAYWWGVLRLMAARGPVFRIDEGFEQTGFQPSQVVLVGRKPS
jgi:SAM-dependent methyltransferase